jgi:tripartite-type tricarboxylate transporter receptor subunit TctC
MTMADRGPLSAALKGGKVRGLSVTSRKEWRLIPTFRPWPAAFPNGNGQLDGTACARWNADADRAKAAREMKRIVSSTEFKERMNAIEVNPQVNTSEQFAAMITSDLTRWRAVAKASNIGPPIDAGKKVSVAFLSRLFHCLSAVFVVRPETLNKRRLGLIS